MCVVKLGEVGRIYVGLLPIKLISSPNWRLELGCFFSGLIYSVGFGLNEDPSVLLPYQLEEL